MAFTINNISSNNVTYQGQTITAGSSYTTTDPSTAFSEDLGLRSDIIAGKVTITVGSNTFGADAAVAMIQVLNDPSPTYNSVLPTLTNSQRATLQADSSGRLNIAPLANTSIVKAQLQDNAGSAITLGQTTMSASVPVAIASNQSTLNTNIIAHPNFAGSVNLTGVNQTVVATVTSGISTVVFNLTGTWVATLIAEGNVDGNNWFAISTYTATGFSTNGQIIVPAGGYQQVRLRVSAYTSGTVVASFQSTCGHNVSLNLQGTSPWLIKSVSNSVGLSLTGAAQTFAISTGGYGSTVFNITGTWVATLVVEGTTDANLWFPINYYSTNGFFPTGNGTIVVPSGGYQQVRLRVSAYTSGTIVCNAQSDLPSNNYAANALLDGVKPTYSMSATVPTAATATDVVTITGGSTKLIRILEIRVSGIGTTALTTPVLLIKRSAANSGGTFSTLTAVPHDSTSAAATITGKSYTVNPTGLGAAVGTMRQDRLTFALTATTAESPIVWRFGDRPGQAIVLRSTSEVLAINLNSVTVLGGSISVDIEWTEE